MENDRKPGVLWEMLNGYGPFSGSSTAVTLASSSATPTESTQILTPAKGKDAFSRVTIDPIPSEYIVPSGFISVNKPGEYNVGSFSTAFVTFVNDEDQIVERTIQHIENNGVSYVGEFAFALSQLKTASFENATYICSYAFQSSPELEQVFFPAAQSIGSSAFGSCVALKNISFPNCKEIGKYAFRDCDSLESVSFPQCVSIRESAFTYCNNLREVYFDEVLSVGYYAFSRCEKLESVYMPKVRSVSADAFISCVNMREFRFPALRTISGSSVFKNCYRLESLYLLYNGICTLQKSNAFDSTPIAGYTDYTSGVLGSIFVPSSRYNAYITGNNWSFFSDRFVSLTDEEIAVLR